MAARVLLNGRGRQIIRRVTTPELGDVARRLQLRTRADPFRGQEPLLGRAGNHGLDESRLEAEEAAGPDDRDYGRVERNRTGHRKESGGARGTGGADVAQ